MGAIAPYPGLVNIVPGRVVATVDLRNPEDAHMRAAERDIVAFYAEVAREERVEITWRQTARTELVPFSSVVQGEGGGSGRGRGGLSSERIISGAGHDAQEMARVCMAGMVFVPGEHDGISHNPREYSTREQCGNGVDVLADVVRGFAEE